MIKLYHGSNTGNIQILEPRQADHDRPYVYLSASEVVAALYLCNAVQKPCYWFPYGFEGDTPVYHELYPNALREVADGVQGYLYEVCVEESKVLPFKNIPCVRLATEPVKVANCIKIENAYNLFLEYETQGKLKIVRFENKTKEQLNWWYASIENDLKEKDMIKKPDCSYAGFIKEKFPQVWEKYIGNSE